MLTVSGNQQDSLADQVGADTCVFGCNTAVGTSPFPEEGCTDMPHDVSTKVNSVSTVQENDS